MEEGRRNVVYKEVDWRVGKLSFLEKLRLPQSFTFSAVSGVVFSTPLFLILCPKLLCYRKEAVYVIFDRRML